jgi:anti-anti-sigma factor
MQIQKSKTGLTFQAEGYFQTATSATVQEQLIETLRKPGKKPILLTFGNEDTLDAAGLKLLIGLARDCREKGLALTVQTKSAAITDMIRLFGLDAFIDLQEA